MCFIFYYFQFKTIQFSVATYQYKMCMHKVESYTSRLQKFFQILICWTKTMLLETMLIAEQINISEWCLVKEDAIYNQSQSVVTEAILSVSTWVYDLLCLNMSRHFILGLKSLKLLSCARFKVMTYFECHYFSVILYK